MSLRGVIGKEGSYLLHKSKRKVSVDDKLDRSNYIYSAYVDRPYLSHGRGAGMGDNNGINGVERCNTDGNCASETVSTAEGQRSWGK